MSVLIWGWLVGTSSLSSAAPWLFQLHEGSTFVDDCLICGRPTIIRPLRGSMILEQGIGASSNQWMVTSLDWIASIGSGNDYVFSLGTNEPSSLTLKGPNQIEAVIHIVATVSGTTITRTLTNDFQIKSRSWPLLDLEMAQTEPNLVTYYRARLLAAPMREIWFSTAGGMTPARKPAPATYLSNGDILSNNGRLVAGNGSLISNLGLMPVIGSLNVDALSILPGGEILFSLDQDVFSETKGRTIHSGDLVTSQGRIFKTYSELLAPFGGTIATPNPGLDAVFVVSTNELWFSIREDLSPKQDTNLLHHGDILSSKGRTVASNQTLLAKFNPVDRSQDYGLDALYVWPSGEIWFSITSGFSDQNYGVINSGDLLSNQGYVVFRNLELTRAFAPIEDTSNFGLDALYVVSDASPASASPQFQRISRISASALALSWNSAARVIQLQKAASLTSPFADFGSLLLGTNAVIPLQSDGNQSAYFRLRAW